MEASVRALLWVERWGVVGEAVSWRQQGTVEVETKGWRIEA